MSHMLTTILFSVSKKKSRSFAKYAKKRSQEKGSVLEKTEIRSFAVQSPSQATIFKLFTTSLVPVRMSGQAFIVIGPRIAANYGLQIQVFGVNLFNSLMKSTTVRRNVSENKEVLQLLFAECFSLV